MLKTKTKWYKNVPEKVKKDWTSEERKNLLELNRKGLSSDEIIEIMGGKLTKVQIYNQVRIAKKIHAKRCYQCGTPTSRVSKTGLIICKNCVKKNGQYKKVLRKRALKHGLCGVCYKNKVIPGHTACRKCLSATHRRRIAKGLCCKCGRRKLDKSSTTLCKVCLTVNGQISRERRDKRK